MDNRMVDVRRPPDMKGMVSAESRRFKAVELSGILSRCRTERDMKG